jgi:hypothetical protein
VRQNDVPGRKKSAGCVFDSAHESAQFTRFAHSSSGNNREICYKTAIIKVSGNVFQIAAKRKRL